ncbi:UV DNA damage repair endonuclease UvsE [Flaviaesturariibacter amylovorans]|uniref:UV DNA damage repair endonuclease UvsE n=1 Tax=Flaviaesturariibacter amylovorans TaxID=1084520 RepID=A0ABP8HCT2_9BACT
MMNLGYACINMQLAEEGVTTNKGMIKRTFQEKGVVYASQLALQNVQALFRILQWNLRNGIGVFRITSELFPWASEYPLEDMPDFPIIKRTLEECGKLPIRVSTHPGPFNKMAGTGATLENTIKDLEIHSRLFDLMGLTPSHWNKINIHVGGAYGDKQESMRRFAENFARLSPNLQQRLTVENDDKPGLYTVADLRYLHGLIGIPIVFDYFHHRLHPGGLGEEEAFHLAYDTWDVRPVFHYSSSRREYEDPKAPKEAHADYIYEPINTYGKEVDIVLEAKMKEGALQRYYQQFGTPPVPPRGHLVR